MGVIFNFSIFNCSLQKSHLFSKHVLPYMFNSGSLWDCLEVTVWYFFYIFGALNHFPLSFVIVVKKSQPVADQIPSVVWHCIIFTHFAHGKMSGLHLALVTNRHFCFVDLNLRRSPRIKQLSLCRTKSGSFYSASQTKSRSVQRVHSFQQVKSGDICVSLFSKVHAHLLGSI